MGIARRGKASVVICSTTFVAMGRAQAARLGFAQLPIGVIQHPFGLRTRAEVRAMAEKLVAEIVALAGTETQR